MLSHALLHHAALSYATHTTSESLSGRRLALSNNVLSNGTSWRYRVGRCEARLGHFGSPWAYLGHCWARRHAYLSIWYTHFVGKRTLE